jgi:hypothetical protein
VATVSLDSATFGVDIWSNEKRSSSKARNAADAVHVNVKVNCRVGVEYVDFRFLARHVNQISDSSG